MKLFIIRPNGMGYGPHPCNIYLHGGAAIFFTSESLLHDGIYAAMTLQCIVIMPEFRNAPEAKVPKGATDVYKTVKYVYDHAPELMVDQSKICLNGKSGGAFLALSAANMLSEAGETKMVKAMFLNCPMLSFETLYVPDFMLTENEALGWTQKHVTGIA